MKGQRRGENRREKEKGGKKKHRDKNGYRFDPGSIGMATLQRKMLQVTGVGGGIMGLISVFGPEEMFNWPPAAQG